MTLASIFFQQLVRDAKGIVIRGHEHASLEIDHGIRNFALASLVHAGSRHVRPDNLPDATPAARAVPVAVDHLEVVDDLALVPDVVSGGDDVDAELEEFLGQRRSDAEAGRRVFAVRDDEIDAALAKIRVAGP